MRPGVAPRCDLSALASRALREDEDDAGAGHYGRRYEPSWLAIAGS